MKCLLLPFFPLMLFGQNLDSSDKKRKNINLVPCPNVSNNQVFGWGGGLILAALYKLNKKDTISPPSMTLIQPMYFQNDTWWVALMQTLYWDENKWRSNVLFFVTEVNFQFSTESYLPNLPSKFIPYSAKKGSLSANLFRRVAPKTYLGVRYIATKNNVDFRDNPILDELGKKFLNTQLFESGLGLGFLYDSRNNVMSPESGLNAYINTYTYFKQIGSDVNYTNIMSEVAYYKKFNHKLVLASKATIQVNFGDVPFVDENIMGFAGSRFGDLRGYNKGEFRGNQLYCAQTELRWNCYKRWSLNTYFGLGTVFNQPEDASWLPAGGMGLRYLVSKQYKVKVGVDYAQGIRDHGIYFIIGEYF